MTEASIHPEAEAEYEDALGWYYERSPRAAERFQATFDEAVEAIRGDTRSSTRLTISSSSSDIRTLSSIGSMETPSA